MSNRKVSEIPSWDDFPETDGSLKIWERVLLNGKEIPGLCTITGTGFKLKTSTKKAAGQDGANVAMLGRDLASFTISVKMWKMKHLTAFQEIIGMAKPKKGDIVSKNKVQTEQWIDLVQSPQESESFSRAEPSLFNSIHSLMKSEENMSRFSSNRFSRKFLIKSDYIENKVIGYEYVPLKIYHPVLYLFGIHEAIIQSITIPKEEQPGLWTSAISCSEFDRAAYRTITRPKSAKADVPLMHKVEGAVPAMPSRRNVGPRD